MSEQNVGKLPTKKILEKSPLAGITVPILIILVGALIIFGVTKMLASGKDHRDLVDELNSKTFGNRWVAAYELSKFIASNKIPKEDIPWVIENLSQVYFESVDNRTRNFVVLAIGSMNNPLALPVLNKALEDVDPQVRFNAVTSLGNMTSTESIEWPKVEALVTQEQDVGLRQVALLTLAAHNRPNIEEKAVPLLTSSENNLRHAAAVVLISRKNEQAIPVLTEILNLRYDVAQAGQLNGAQVEGLKINVLENIEKSKWNALVNLVAKVESEDTNIRVTTKAKQVLKVLKN
ncbi:MAG: HEAT repeat domain-containing protein [Bdellovibrionota bacterium]